MGPRARRASSQTASSATGLKASPATERPLKLPSRGDAELLVGVCEVGLHRSEAQEELLGDLAVGVARQELHPALGAMTRLLAHNIGVHRTGIGGVRGLDGDELHPALRGVIGLGADDLGMHRTGVDDVASGSPNALARQ